MKTNKERAKLILEKYKAAKKNETVKKVPLEEKKKRIFVFNKKAIISVCTACVMVLTLGLGLGLGLGLSGGDDGYGKLNLNNKIIVNFDEYTSLGAGELSGQGALTGTNSKVSIMSRGGGRGHHRKLVGVKKDGTVEEIKVSDTGDQTSEVEEISWELGNIVVLNNFSIACYTTISTVGTGNWFSTDNESSITVIIDNKTGKMYSLDSLLTKGTTSVYFGIDSNYIFGYDGIESDDSLFVFLLNGYIVDEGGEDFSGYYKFSIVDGNLSVEKMFANNQLTPSYRGHFVDRFGNTYLTNNIPYYGNTCEAKYIVKADGTLHNFNMGVYKSLNGIVYTSDMLQFVNANGELENNPFTEIPQLFLATDSLVKKEGNIEYYFEQNKLYKVVWKDDVVFTYEKLNEISAGKYVVTKDKIFFMGDQTISSLEIISGKEELLSSEYFFSSIDTDNLGNVLFVAIDADFQKVEGVIRNDGTIETNVTPNKYTVYYIKPLN